MPKSDIDKGGVMFADTTQFWEEIKDGQRVLSKADLVHINECEACQEMALRVLAARKIKISSHLMTNISGKFREKVIRTICLNAVGSSVFN